MKLARYNADKLGLVRNEQLIDVTGAIAAIGQAGWPLPPGDRLIGALDAVRVRVEGLRKSGFVQLHASVSLKSPVANPTKVIGVSAKDSAHAAQADAEPRITAATAETIDDCRLCLRNPVPVGAGEGCMLSSADRNADHEVALAMIIGRTARDVAEAEALDCLAGYAIGLNITERRLHKRAGGFSVLGPWLVTAEEVPDPDALALRLGVNGRPRQETSTAMQIFDCRRLIACASRSYTLYPGDLIMASPPGEVGPIVPGDVVRCEIERIGVMEVAVRTA